MGHDTSWSSAPINIDLSSFALGRYVNDFRMVPTTQSFKEKERCCCSTIPAPSSAGRRSLLWTDYVACPDHSSVHEPRITQIGPHSPGADLIESGSSQCGDRRRGVVGSSGSLHQCRNYQTTILRTLPEQSTEASARNGVTI